jgi:hypothetical protein
MNDRIETPKQRQRFRRYSKVKRTRRAWRSRLGILITADPAVGAPAACAADRNQHPAPSHS